MKKTSSIILLSSLLLSACAGTGKSGDGSYQPEKDDEALIRISEAVRVTDSAYRSVAAVGGVTTVRGGVSSGDPAVPSEDVPDGTSSGGTDPTPPNVVLPPHAVQPVTITWNGELEALLLNLAQRGGYTFSTTGQRPPAPMMVSIVADEEPLFGVVRRSGMMSRGYADVAFNPSSREITLRYGG